MIVAPEIRYGIYEITKMFFLRLMEGGPHLVAQTCNRREWIKNYKTKRSADMIPVRCNPDVAPRLTSGGYEEKVDVITSINILFIGGGKFWSLMQIKLMLLLTYYPNQHIVHRGWRRWWRILIPYGDIVDAFTPINILFRGGGKLWTLITIKLLLLPQSTYCSEGVATFNLIMIMMWWWW